MYDVVAVSVAPVYFQVFFEVLEVYEKAKLNTAGNGTHHADWNANFGFQPRAAMATFYSL